MQLRVSPLLTLLFFKARLLCHGIIVSIEIAMKENALHSFGNRKGAKEGVHSCAVRVRTRTCSGLEGPGLRDEGLQGFEVFLASGSLWCCFGREGPLQLVSLVAVRTNASKLVQRATISVDLVVPGHFASKFREAL